MNKQDANAASRAYASLLTPQGRGAVASIRFEGDCGLIDAADPPLFRAANGKPLSRQAIRQVVFGRWGIGTEEEIVLCRTSPEVLDLHSHGGNAAVGRILADLESLGCRIETWQSAESRDGGIFESECLQCVARAQTVRTAGILLEQQTGVLRSALEDLLSQVRRVARGESADPPDEVRATLASRLGALERWSDFGLHLCDPWGVVLVGRPNVGKSSLMNALLGYSRSIVYDQPGTTRDVLSAQTALEGWAMNLIDTAGLRSDAPELEAAGIALAEAQIERADCRVLLLDTSQPPGDDDWRLIERWPDALLVAHKSDLPNVWHGTLPSAAVSASSLFGTGIADLASTLVNKLVPEIPPPGTAIPITTRQVALIRRAAAALQSDDWQAFRSTLEECLG